MDEEWVTVKQAARAWLELDAVLVPLDGDDLPPDAIFEALHVLSGFISQYEPFEEMNRKMDD